MHSILTISYVTINASLAGFSDPYCMLGILPGARVIKDRLQESHSSYSSDEEAAKGGKKESALKKFSQSFKKKKDKTTARDMIPAKYIKCTSVKPNTLNPVWNERFTL
jgi:BAI1-associated protein 3